MNRRKPSARPPVRPIGSPISLLPSPLYENTPPTAAAEKKLSQQAGSASEETARLEQAVVATKRRADKLGTQSINVRTAADLL